MKFYEHQKTGIEFLTAHPHAINADDMGLGKSLQNIISCLNNNCNRILIICPNSLKYVWKDEIEKWAPESSIVVVVSKTSNFDEREAQIKSKARFTIINYELVGTLTRTKKDENKTVISKTIDMRHRLSLVKEKWDAVILDEAHKVRNRSSKSFRGCQTIITNAKPKVIIPTTGTPLYTKVENLWTLLHFADRATYSSYYKWIEQHCITKHVIYSPYPKVVRIRDVDALKANLTDVILRRLKEDVLDLPPRTIINVDVDLSESHRKIYDKLARDLYVTIQTANNGGRIELSNEYDDSYDFSGLEINVVNKLALLSRQKQIAISADLLDPSTDALTGAKVDAMLDIIDGLGDQKMVIFSQYATVIRRLWSIIDQKLNIDSVTLTGKVKSTLERQARIKRFQEGDDCRIMLSTFQTGGVGVTLTAASVVGCMDLMWSPGDNNQGIDRVSRIGQTKPVTIYNINARNTVEDKIIQTLGDRNKLFDQLLSQKDVMHAALSSL